MRADRRSEITAGIAEELTRLDDEAARERIAQLDPATRIAGEAGASSNADTGLLFDRAWHTRAVHFSMPSIDS